MSLPYLQRLELEELLIADGLRAKSNPTGDRPTS